MTRQARPRRWGAALTAAVLAASLAACGSNGEGDVSGGSSEILIGAVSSLTGNFAALSVLPGGLKTAADQINAEGGVNVDGKTYKLKVVVVDDKSDSANAGVVTQGLIRDNDVHFVFGPDTSPTFTPTAPVTSQAKVIQFSTAIATANGLEDQGPVKPYDLVFSQSPGTTDLMTRAIEGMAKLWPGLKTGAVMVPGDASYDAYAQAAVDGLKAVGIDVVDTIRFDATTKNFSSFLTGLKSKAPDVVITGTSTPVISTIAAQAAELGGVTKHLVGMGIYTPPGGLGKGTTLPFDFGWYALDGVNRYQQTPVLEQFLKDYEKTNGEAPPESTVDIAPYYRGPLRALVSAMEKAGTVTDTAAIAKALTEVSVEGIGGEPVSWNKNHVAQVTVNFCGVPAGATKPEQVTCEGVAPR